VAITFVNGSSASTTGSANPSPGPVPGIQNGDLYVIFTVSKDNIAHTAPTGWVQKLNVNNTVTTHVSIFYARYKSSSPNSANNEVSSPPTISRSTNTAPAVTRLLAFRGVAPFAQNADPFGAFSASVSATGTAISTPAITTVTGGELPLHFVGAGTGTTANSMSSVTGITNQALVPAGSSSAGAGRAAQASWYGSRIADSGTSTGVAAATASVAPSTTNGWTGVQGTLIPSLDATGTATSLIATSTLGVVDGSKDASGTASLTSSTLDVVEGTKDASGTAALSGTATLDSLNAARDVIAAVSSLTGTASLSAATGISERSGAVASLTAVATLASATAQRNVIAAVSSLTGTASLSAVTGVAFWVTERSGTAWDLSSTTWLGQPTSIRAAFGEGTLALATALSPAQGYSARSGSAGTLSVLLALVGLTGIRGEMSPVGTLRATPLRHGIEARSLRHGISATPLRHGLKARRPKS
jgi:hypothetical protein